MRKFDIELWYYRALGYTHVINREGLLFASKDVERESAADYLKIPFESTTRVLNDVIFKVDPHLLEVPPAEYFKYLNLAQLRTRDVIFHDKGKPTWKYASINSLLQKRVSPFTATELELLYQTLKGRTKIVKVADAWVLREEHPSSYLFFEYIQAKVDVLLKNLSDEEKEEMMKAAREFTILVMPQSHVLKLEGGSSSTRDLNDMLNNDRFKHVRETVALYQKSKPL